ncbi:MAG: antioxidant, AhpC/Tsa family protein [Osedax symbiont Rs2]|nr:MAG: antioxidant, AhpC/Tsa family protein [Osedax symbiont Rs2]
MISIGSPLPAGHLKVMGENGPELFDTAEQFSAKKIVLFAVPGAFTPTCSAAHLPGYVVAYDDIIAAGADAVICLSVNDVFVMHAWGQSANAENLLMLADGNGTFNRALGLDKDASEYQMGTRSRRYAMIIDNGILTHLAIDDKGLDQSSAEAILAKL